MSVIFVGGIHAVGKSTTCARVSERLDLPHYSAGAVIREGSNNLLTVDKRVADIQHNQSLLVSGTQQILKRHQNIILDGHFTLLTVANSIEPIPSEVFKELSIAGLIVFIDSPEAISDRKLKRDGMPTSILDARAHQDMEVSHAMLVAETLGLDLQVLKAFSDIEMTRFISEYLK